MTVHALSADLEALHRVVSAARACIAWQAEHDTYKCMHGIENQDCRACANEPPHFPVGVNEFVTLQAAVRMLDPVQDRPVDYGLIEGGSPLACVDGKKRDAK